MDVDIFLATAVFGNADLVKSLDDAANPDINILLRRNPVEAFFKDREFELALEKTGGPIVDSGWSEPIGSVSNLPTSGTLGKRLGVTRTEIKVIDGERVVHAFNANGDLVDVQWLLPEAG